MKIVEPDTIPLLVPDSSAVTPVVKPEGKQTPPPADFKQKDLKKELALVAEDTTALGPDPENLVEVSEQLLINKEWITLHEYYAVWDTRNINPYNIDVKSFTDTVSLLLYEEPHSLWSPPLDNMQVTSEFGFRTPRWHYGTDVRLNVGDSVRSVFDGIIRIRKYDPSGYGYYIVVRHKNGLETLYGHLSKQLVEVGNEVKAGDVIGLGGNTGRSSGPHLHFETRYLGTALNPAEVYDFSQNILRNESIVVSQASFSYLKEAKKIVYHRVRSGDTLSRISRRYGVPINTLLRLNKLRKNSVLRVGQRIRVH